jgi:shikimate dehydrogenase
VDPRGRRVLVLGAGGAARAITAELALAGAASVLVLNRTRERGEPMAADLRRNTSAEIAFAHWRETWRVAGDIDLVVNATPIGLYPHSQAMPDIDLSGLQPRTLVADAVFNPPRTALLAAARGMGLPVLDGLSMLVYQGAIGFEMWTGLPAPEQVMKTALARALGAASSA